AYDAMISDRVYRKGKSQEEAFAELRRCAGFQFDPELVERFIKTVLARDENRTASKMPVTKQTALQIGMQIEKLAIAADARDLQTLALMAKPLGATAAKHRISPIAEAASQLEKSIEQRNDLGNLMELTVKLMELCRSTYDAYLPGPTGPASRESPGRRTRS